MTGQAASTSRLMATNAAVAGTRLRSMPARRAGSPPIRSGVSAQAASPKAFSTKESQKPIRWPSPWTIHWMRQARATRSIDDQHHADEGGLEERHHALSVDSRQGGVT